MALGILLPALACRPMTISPRPFLTSIFRAAVAAADPERTIRARLPERPKGRTIVIGAGKGSAQMAAAVERAWDGPIEGLIVTRYGYGCKTERIAVLEAAHPVPDEAGLVGSRRLLDAVSGLTKTTLSLRSFPAAVRRSSLRRRRG